MKGTSVRSRGFTLVEVLAAAAVLSLLVLIILQVMSVTGQAITINTKSLDAASQARLVFDRIGMDWAARPNRSDLGMVFTKKGSGSDAFRFYSQVSSYSGTRSLTAVGYFVPSAASGQKPAYELERGATGTDWPTTTGAGAQSLLFLPSALSAADTAPDSPPDNPLADYEVLATGVFRLEFCYITSTGSLTINNPNTSPTDYTGIAGVVIALAVIDTKSLVLLNSPSTQLSSLSNALPKTMDGSDPVAGWNTAINAGLGVPGIPKPVLENLRVYERTFYVQ